MSFRITYLIILMILSFAEPTLGASRGDFSEIYRKWTARYHLNGDYLYITFLNSELLAAWEDHSDSEYTRSRIQELQKLVREDGLQIFLTELDVNCCYTGTSDAISLAPPKDSFRLIKSGVSSRGVSPDLVHPATELLIKRDQVGIGVVAFKTKMDKFETMTLRVIPSHFILPRLPDDERDRYRLARGEEKDEFYTLERTSDLLIPILPDGVHSSIRMSDRRNYADMISILRIALSVARLFPRG